MIYESDYYVGSDLNGDSLAHHGVRDQRWGVRNGPPYPVRRGSEVHYNVGKMTDKTKSSLKKAGSAIVKAVKSAGSKAKSSVKSTGPKVSSSFKKWKENRKAELAVKPTDNALLKGWQKKQLRISDMTNQDLQQRIERKRLEESYKRALRGDFSDPKTWGKSAKDAKSAGGKRAADTILGKIGTAAVEGVAAGVSRKITNSMAAKSARREALRDSMAKVAREAQAERKQFVADQRNADWRNRKAASYERSVDPEIRRDYYARLYSGNSDMDDLWNRVGPSM